jgi:hypothetical protein
VHFASRLSEFWTDSASVLSVTLKAAARVRNRYGPRGFSEERETDSGCSPRTFVSLSGVIPQTTCIYICLSQDRQWSP